jgi:hypothetical protein
MRAHLRSKGHLLTPALKMEHFGHGIVQCAPTLTSIQDLFQPNSWQTPVAAGTVYSAPDDGHKGRPKHVEHTCSF